MATARTLRIGCLSLAVLSSAAALSSTRQVEERTLKTRSEAREVPTPGDEAKVADAKALAELPRTKVSWDVIKPAKLAPMTDADRELVKPKQAGRIEVSFGVFPSLYDAVAKGLELGGREAIVKNLNDPDEEFRVPGTMEVLTEPAQAVASIRAHQIDRTDLVNRGGHLFVKSLLVKPLFGAAVAHPASKFDTIVEFTRSPRGPGGRIAGEVMGGILEGFGAFAEAVDSMFPG